jgi:hypothetical protein
MPLVVVTSTVPHEPYVVRVDAIDYTVVTSSTVTTYVPKEHLASFITAVQAADSNATVTTRPE